jgi:flagellar assembly protein FliH
MSRVFSSPTVDGIYVLNYTDAYVKGKKDGLNVTPKRKNATSEAARKEGYQQGLNDAKKEFESSKQEVYGEGMKDGCKQVEEKLATIFQAVQDAVRQLQSEKGNIWQRCEPEILKLVLAIVQKVVGYEVTNNSQLIEKMVAEAILQAGNHKIVSIHINPDDITKLKGTEIMNGFDNTFEIVADRKIGHGGCVVETDFGCIDAQLETRIDEVISEMITHRESYGQVAEENKSD